MMTKISKNIKVALQAVMHNLIEEQMVSLHKAKISIEESKLNETKSSAGDKFETGRAMMQQEQDKIESQLDLLSVTKNRLKQMSPNSKHDIGVIGALIITDISNYYISVSLGKMIVDDDLYYAISPEAPLSKMMMGKTVGDRVAFRERSYHIIDIK